MLATVKSRIITITLVLLIVLGVLATVLSWKSFSNNKTAREENCNNKVAYFSEQINNSIGNIETNVKDLATIGNIYYNRGLKNQEVLDYAIQRNFEINEISIGGGIWFEPYKILPKQERVCSYAFNNGQKVVIDRTYNTPKYDYHNQMWYKTVKRGVKKGELSVWTPPYFDDAGTNALMITVGSGIYDSNNNFVGMSTSDWELNSIIEGVSALRPTQNSFALLADTKNDYIVALTEQGKEKESIGKSLSTIKWYSKDIINGKKFIYNEKEYISFFRDLHNNLVLIVNVPTGELYGDLIQRFHLLYTLILVTFILITLALYKVLKINVNEPIQYMVNMAEKIGNGDLDAKIHIESPKEFAVLAKSFNKMTQDVKDYVNHINKVTTEKKKMESELNIAKSIQHSILPKVFPPYPDHKEFDIYASMETAKEVGGDFYDFFFIDPNHFAFVIADVSGKGIPAALFMMTVKTMLKSTAKMGLTLEDAITKVNQKICKTNDQGLFVTVFMAVVELSTGVITYVNGGHNPPLIKHPDGKFEYLKVKPNLVIGAMNNIRYTSEKDKLNAGDILFMYTDGVTEALNSKQKFYGDNRLEQTLNKIDDLTVENVLNYVKNDVKDFTDGEEQADDITMLTFRYNGVEMIMGKTETEIITDANSNETKFFMPAVAGKFKNLIEWLDSKYDALQMADAYRAKLNVAVEEIFANIANYAYPPKEGDVEINFKINNGNEIEMQFVDSGTPYNPLEQQAPDVTLGLDDRPIGGLGIFIVKNSMDYMGYEFKDNKNVLTIKMTFEQQ